MTDFTARARALGSAFRAAPPLRGPRGETGPPGPAGVDGSGEGGAGIGAGAYVGQPAVWDGTAWAPLEPGNPLVLDRLASEAALLVEPIGEFRVTAATIVLDATPFSTGSITVDSSSVAVTGTELGFFGAAPASRPSITLDESGTSYVNQIISALVALGLVTDDRLS